MAGHVADYVYLQSVLALYKSNMSNLHDRRCISWVYLRKLAICLITLVTLLFISVLYAPILQEAKFFIVKPQGPFKSTCSYSADQRGPNQRIISYSIYGNFSHENLFRKYLIPFKDTLKSIPSIYPGKLKLFTRVPLLVKKVENKTDFQNIKNLRVDCKDLS